MVSSRTRAGPTLGKGGITAAILMLSILFCSFIGVLNGLSLTVFLVIATPTLLLGVFLMMFSLAVSTY